MKQCRWSGNPICSFCKEVKLPNIYFLHVQWPRWCGDQLEWCWEWIFVQNHWQFYAWCHVWEIFFTVGLAAVTWAIWPARNRATLENKMIKNPLRVCLLLILFNCIGQGCKRRATWRCFALELRWSTQVLCRLWGFVIHRRSRSGESDVLHPAFSMSSVYLVLCEPWVYVVSWRLFCVSLCLLDCCIFCQLIGLVYFGVV